MNFLDTGEIEDYWANTSSNSLVSRLLREGSERIKREFEALLRGEVLRCSIDEQIVFNQLDQDEDAVWSLLVAAGYLKVLDYEKKVSGKRKVYDLNLTNGEVRDMFYDMVRAAHAQMEEMQYAAILIAKGIPAGHICQYGFAFEGKTVLIG